jgi:demethylmenaquinone methyltransferase/2-methoxy-6-polyprenyl-1,4-benzoquinol methylase
MDIDCFEKWAENWEVSAESKIVAGIFVKELINKGSGLILDLACGKGVLRDYFNENLPESVVVYVDKAFAMIKGLREIYSDELVIRGEGENIPFDENKFDAVIIFNSFPHFTDKEKTIAECYRVLKKGGRLIIGHSMTPEEINQLHRDVGEAVANHRLPERDIFIKMFDKAGFKNIEYFVDGYFYVMGFKE